MLHTIPLLDPEHDISPPSNVPLNCCVRLPDICNCVETGKEQGPPAKAYDGDGEGIALVILENRIRYIFDAMVVICCAVITELQINLSYPAVSKNCRARPKSLAAIKYKLFESDLSV